MKKLSIVLVSLLAACELQPAPKQAPPPPAPGSAVIEAPPAGSGAPAVGSAAPPMPHPAPPPAIQPTAECEQAAIKVAELLVNDAEPSQKPAMERERADIVRNTEAACTRMSWTQPALACIAQSKSNNDAHACLEKFPPPTAAPAAGSGSAAPVHPHPPSKTPH